MGNNSSNKINRFYLLILILYLGLIISAKYLLILNIKLLDLRIIPISLTILGSLISLIIVFKDNIRTFFRNFNKDSIVSIIVSISIISVLLSWRFSLFLLILLSLISIYNILNKKGYGVIFLSWIFPIYILFEFIYLYKTPNITIGLSLISKQLPFLLLPIISYGVRLKKKQLTDILSITFRISMVYMMVNLALYVFIYQEYTDSLFSFIGFNKFYFSYYPKLYVGDIFILHGLVGHYNMGIPIFSIIYLYAIYINHQNKIFQNIEVIVYFILLSSFIFINQSRYGMIILPIILGIQFIQTNYLKPLIKYILYRILLILYIIIFPFMMLYISFIDPIRQKIYKDSIKLIKSSNYMGLGTGMDLKKLSINNITLLHSHNNYISVTVDLGIIGLVIITLFSLSVFYTGYKKNNIFLLFYGIIFYPLSWVDSFFYTQEYIIIIFCLLSFAIILSKRNKNTI